MRWPLRNGPCGATKGGGLDDQGRGALWRDLCFYVKILPSWGGDSVAFGHGVRLVPSFRGPFLDLRRRGCGFGGGRGVSGVFGDGGRGEGKNWPVVNSMDEIGRSGNNHGPTRGHAGVLGRGRGHR